MKPAFTQLPIEKPGATTRHPTGGAFKQNAEPIDSARRQLVKVIVSAAVTMTVPAACSVNHLPKAANDNTPPSRPFPPGGVALSPARKRFPKDEATQTFLFETYGDPKDSKTLLKVSTPWTMRLAWDAPVNTRHYLWAHRKVAGSLERVLKTVYKEYGLSHIQRLGLDVFGGDHIDRNMRGTDRWSLHAWGVAFDFDPEQNQYAWNHRRARMAHSDYDDWWHIWASEGWYSLGRHHDYDWMHIQAAWRK